MTDFAHGINKLQADFAAIAKERGWDGESPKDILVLLTEELGELARAVRKHEGMIRDQAYDTELAEELADVQNYIIHLANTTGVDLQKALIAKEAKNAERFKNRK